ncbi:MAG: class I SAM-dependent rRNA methyltransferase [Alphaproteobacteria bacterium]|nr:class I SAM-dependent rRNA methyltransferase [Alphaproteobacteria bacterium]
MSPSESVKSLPAIRLKPGAQRRLGQGHPWAFSNEIAMDEAAKALAPGSLVRLLQDDGEAVGLALFNPRTLIAARLLTRSLKRPVDEGFLRERIDRALGLRARLFDEPYYRLVHAEADGLPGLVADRLGDTLVLEVNCAGMERLERELLAAFESALGPERILLKNDAPVRALEGLALETRMAKGAFDGPMEVRENGLAYLADPAGGQKTGWFYDQRENRAFAARLARGARVLDAYSYTGGFALLCAAAGASRVVALDRSEGALALLADAARRNGLDVTGERGEAFAALEAMAGEKRSFDIVVVDPPAFVKSRKDLGAGTRAYRKLARLAARLVAPGGILCAASCSHLVSREAFAAEIAAGLLAAGREGRILRFSGAAPDHPVHAHLPETDYLKFMAVALD